MVELVSEGITTGRGKRMAYVHRDGVNGVLRPRRGARLAALTSGGAIAEVGDYRVVAEPDDTPVGTVNEDFAIESMVGDVFLLGTHSWRIRRVDPGRGPGHRRRGRAPHHPVLGGRGAEPDRRALRGGVRRCCRRTVGGASVGPMRARPRRSRRNRGRGREAARAHVEQACGLDADAADQVVAVPGGGAGRAGRRSRPHDDIVFERFFDEAGGMQMVVHAPLGGRINRGLGLALRKRFCATFDFELQAAANDDAVVLSLGPQHSFPLDSAPRLLRSETAEGVLRQAVLASPMFAARWRWNLNRSLAVLRFRGGKKNPLPIQRMEADDLMAAVFPALAACQENAPGGPIVIPDHVLVRQTLLRLPARGHGRRRPRRALASAWRPDAVRVHFVDSTEPSVLAHEILNGKPYTFLDDAPLEERRTRAVATAPRPPAARRSPGPARPRRPRPGAGRGRPRRARARGAP